MHEFCPAQRPSKKGKPMPTSYRPYAYSAPLPSALLRPVKQPLYDTIEYGSAHVFKEPVLMFGIDAVNSATIRSNMERAFTLPSSLEFSLFGFSVFFHSMENFPIQFFSEHVSFKFVHNSSKYFLEIPLCMLPNGTDWYRPTQKALVGLKKNELDLDAAVAWLQTAPFNPEKHSDTWHKQQAQQIKQQMQDGRIYDFTIGTDTLRLRAGESFRVELRFAEPLNIASPVKMTVFLHGLMWKPI